MPEEETPYVVMINGERAVSTEGKQYLSEQAAKEIAKRLQRVTGTKAKAVNLDHNPRKKKKK